MIENKTESKDHLILQPHEVQNSIDISQESLWYLLDFPRCYAARKNEDRLIKTQAKKNLTEGKLYVCIPRGQFHEKVCFDEQKMIEN